MEQHWRTRRAFASGDTTVPVAQLYVEDCVPQLQEVLDVLQALAPLPLAESWDNVGLLLGDRQQPVERVLTCLTLTSEVADEAVREGIQLIVSHHPILFKPVQRLTTDDPQGGMLLKLARQGVAVYSPHTAFDSALEGINQQLAELLGLRDIRPLVPSSDQPTAGTGRFGELTVPSSLQILAQQVKLLLHAPQLCFTGDPQRLVRRVAIGCGAAADFAKSARPLGCDVLVTGEARFHAHLEARELGFGLIVAGHYQTERPAVESLAQRLHTAFPEVAVQASQAERDPLTWV